MEKVLVCSQEDVSCLMVGECQTLLTCFLQLAGVFQLVSVNVRVTPPIRWQLVFFWHPVSLKYGHISFKLLL